MNLDDESDEESSDSDDDFLFDLDDEDNSDDIKIDDNGTYINGALNLYHEDSSISIAGGSMSINQLVGDLSLCGYNGVNISSGHEINLTMDGANLSIANDVSLSAEFGSLNLTGKQINLTAPVNIGKYGTIKDVNGVTAIYAGKYPNTSYQGNFALGHYQSTAANPKNCFEISQSGNVLATGWIKAEGQLQGASLKLGSTTITEA